MVRQVARDAFRPALQMAIETDVIYLCPQESRISRSVGIVTAGAHARGVGKVWVRHGGRWMAFVTSIGLSRQHGK